jgi:hypothetical protein
MHSPVLVPSQQVVFRDRDSNDKLRLISGELHPELLPYLLAMVSDVEYRKPHQMERVHRTNVWKSGVT